MGVTLAFLPWLTAAGLAAQAGSGGTAHDPYAQTDSTVPTFRVTTREVVVDLIALDRRNQPVLDLKPNEVQVSELAGPETKNEHTPNSHAPIAPVAFDPITSLSIFAPADPASSKSATHTGFRIVASCLERSTVHYLLAFHPAASGWTSGYHRIAITTNRPGISLLYRHRYYVGATIPAPENRTASPQTAGQLLQQSACYYPVRPLSITLHARVIDSGRADVVRYLVSVDASSLSFLTLDDGASGRSAAGLQRRVAVDYGACNFDQSGKPISYFNAPLEQVLTSAEYARALDRGFPHILELPASARIALTRVVLRDRATGNMGAVDLTLGPFDQSPPPQRASAVGSFGSVVPAAHSFCADVYELSQTSDRLPDFRELDPIGSIYTSSLNVPNQVFMNTSGIPGVTPRTNLFGIDYHASFWVRTPGEYRFRMASDDGAILQIDDSKVIDLDGLHQVNEGSASISLKAGLHTIHVPYYQGAVNSVALQLWVMPPGAKKWAIFDLRDYQPPAQAPHSHE